jgi:hypothetical protein
VLENSLVGTFGAASWFQVLEMKINRSLDEARKRDADLSRRPAVISVGSRGDHRNDRRGLARHLPGRASEDEAILDLVYEARDIPQELGSPQKVDAWFEAKTKGLNGWQKAALREQWGTMQKVLSSRSGVWQCPLSATNGLMRRKK